MQFINLFFTINHTFVLKLERKEGGKREEKRFLCDIQSISQEIIIFLLLSIYNGTKVETYVH